MLLEDFLESRLIGNVDLVENWTLSAEQFYAIQADFRGVVQAVNDDDLEAILEQSESGERSNVSGATVSLESQRLMLLRILTPRSWRCVQGGGFMGFRGVFTNEQGKTTYPVIRTVPFDILAIYRGICACGVEMNAEEE